MKLNILGLISFILISACASTPKVKNVELVSLWAVDLSSGPQYGSKKHEQASPLIVGDDIFQGSGDGRLAVISKYNGFVKRDIKDPGSIEASPLFNDGVVYFGNTQGYVKAFSYRLGDYLWSYYTAHPVVSSPAFCDGRVFVLSSSNVFYSLDAKTGKVLWSIRREFPSGVPVVKGGSSPVCYDDVVYVGFSDGSFVGANVTTGAIVLDKKLATVGKFKDVDATPYIDEKYIIEPSYDGNLYCLDRKSGQIIWSIKDGSAKSVAVIGEDIYYSTSDGFIYLIGMIDGSVKWRTKLSKGLPTAPATVKNFIVVGSSERGIMLFDKTSGAFIKELNTGTGLLADPVVDGDDILFMSNYGVLYSVRIL